MKSKASISPRSLVILTGAGISAESGIDTFRASDGLWENHKISEVATPEGFAANPIRVHEFYNARRAALKTVTPNAAHDALARLLAYSHKDNSELDVLLVTQNVDDLHERAGASAVIHMHGELSRAKCTACDWSWSFEGDMSLNESCPACHSVKTVRPDIVWFGEIPYAMKHIEVALVQCDLFVSIGTSGAVFPAGGFVQLARAGGADTLELNLERSEGSHHFQETRLGKASALVPKWVDSLIR